MRELKVVSLIASVLSVFFALIGIPDWAVPLLVLAVATWAASIYMVKNPW